MQSSFAYCVCQPGAEPALKHEVAARLEGWKFAFSRPGFVTFKLPAPQSVERFEPVRLTFARAMGLSFARLPASPTLGELAQSVWELEQVRSLVAAGPVALHVWQRDPELPGEDRVEPHATALSIEAMNELRRIAPEGALLARAGSKDEPTAESVVPESVPEGVPESPLAHEPEPAIDGEPAEAAATTREPTQSDAAPTAAPTLPATRLCLDVAMIEPNEWWVGAHAIRSRVDRWPGGVPKIELPDHAVSRAYLKLWEGLRWSALPTLPGDHWLELGCAPGGASQALCDAGMRVTGVDPAEVDEDVLAERRFRHLRMRVADLRPADLATVRWLAVDLNIAPVTTLDEIERLATDPAMHLRGMLITLKLLASYMADPAQVAACIERVRSWGFTDVRTRQLAFNRREYVLAAVKNRGQRRMVRRPVGRKRSPRTEG
ncbi:MAG: SAM-dependent methyltransferase [Lacipirellulaceae bacterium]